MTFTLDARDLIVQGPSEIHTACVGCRHKTNNEGQRHMRYSAKMLGAVEYFFLPTRTLERREAA